MALLEKQSVREPVQLHAGLPMLGAVTASALLLYLAIALYIPRYTPDDAYISYRYAENLAKGDGLTFNSSEDATEGFTNLLWVLVSAPLSRLGNTFDVVPMLGLLLGAATIALVALYLRRRGYDAFEIALPLLASAASAPFVVYAYAGLETPLFAFLLMAMLVGYERVLSRGGAWWYMLAGLGFLLTLTRPEGVVAFPLLVTLTLAGPRVGIEGAEVKKQTLVVATVAYLTALILYEAWRLAYFGEPLPLPFLSKGGPSESLIASWKSNFNNYFVRQNYDAAPFGFYYLMLGVPAVLLTAAQLLHRRLSLADVAPVAMLVAFATIYLNFVDWMPGMRYQAPLVVLSVLPLASVVRVLGVPPGSRIVMQASLLCAMLFASFFAAAQLRLDVKADIRAQELALDALGRWLQESVPEGTLLAMTDVGGAPYYSGLPTLDINPQSLIDLRIARDGLTPDYFFQEQPGIVVFPSRAEDRLDMFPELHAIEDDSRFRQYRLLGVLRHSFFPNSGAERWYRVYAHESVDISAEATSRFPKGNVSDNAADR